jgi:hypothetical protein
VCGFFFSKKNTTPRYFRDMKARVLSFVFFLLALAAHAQPTPYFGFQDAMPLRRGEAQWLTSGVFNHARVGVGRYVDVGFGLPFTFISAPSLKWIDWNMSANVGGYVASRWHLGASFFTSVYRHDHPAHSPLLRNIHRTALARVTYGSRFNHVSLQFGGFKTDFWGHYPFSEGIMEDDLFAYWNSSNSWNAFGGSSMLLTLGRVSGRMELSYFRHSLPAGYRMPPRHYVMGGAGVRFNAGWSQIEFGSTAVFQRWVSTSRAQNRYALAPRIQWILPLTRHTRRLWREDATRH